MRIAPRRAVLSMAAAIVGVLLFAAPAFAHVTANPNEGPAGGFFKSDFRVGHGCDGAATTEVRMQIPDGVVSVKPQVKPGWEIELKTGELSEPVDLHGETITEGVTEIAWTGGKLEDAHMDEFGVSMRLPETPGETLYFPFVQECENGESLRWIQIPDSVEEWDSLEEPAPYITLTAAGGEAEGEATEAAEAIETAAGGNEELTSAQSGGTSPIVWVALVLGALGFLLGLVASLRGRRS